MSELKNDDWVLSVKNKKLNFGFGVPLKMDDPKHQKIYGFIVDEANQILEKNGFTNREEN